MTSAARFVLFQLGWLGAVQAAAHGRVWLGAAAMLPAIALHLFCARRPWRALAFLLAVGVVGTALDSGLQALGALSYPSSAAAWPHALVPPWISALWLGFAVLCGSSLAWLAPRPALALVLGALGGPLSYLAGARLGAVGVGEPALLTWACLALEYAVLTPLLIGRAQVRGINMPNK